MASRGKIVGRITERQHMMASIVMWLETGFGVLIYDQAPLPSGESLPTYP
jgi:hypothetical protein